MLASSWEMSINTKDLGSSQEAHFVNVFFGKTTPSLESLELCISLKFDSVKARTYRRLHLVVQSAGYCNLKKAFARVVRYGILKGTRERLSI